SILLGPWWTPASESDAVSWLTLAATTAGVILAVLRAPADRRSPIIAFAVLCVSTYRLIALAPAPLARVVLRHTGGQLAVTMRYPYVPLGFLVITLALALDVVLGRTHTRRPAFVMLGWAALLLVSLLPRGVPVDLHDASRAEVERALRAIDAGVGA